MPGVQSFKKMHIGKKGGGKHWTADEVEKREKAAKKVTRPKPKKPKVPDWLSAEERIVWRSTLKNMEEFDILDKVDGEALAIYCNAVIKVRDLSRLIDENGYTVIGSRGGETVSPYVTAQQSYSKILLQYADKLGITADSRARLAAKIANENDEDGDNDDMFG